MDEFEAICQKFSKRLGDLGWFFLLWGAGWLVLLLASIGAAQVSLTLFSVWWRVILWSLILFGCAIWNIYIPLYYAYTSFAVLIGFFIDSFESHLVEKHPLEFTKKPLFEGVQYDMYERYL